MTSFVKDSSLGGSEKIILLTDYHEGENTRATRVETKLNFKSMKTESN